MCHILRRLRKSIWTACLLILNMNIFTNIYSVISISCSRSLGIWLSTSGWSQLLTISTGQSVMSLRRSGQFITHSLPHGRNSLFPLELHSNFFVVSGLFFHFSHDIFIWSLILYNQIGNCIYFHLHLIGFIDSLLQFSAETITVHFEILLPNSKLIHFQFGSL